jgi:hypothetical protein
MHCLHGVNPFAYARIAVRVSVVVALLSGASCDLTQACDAAYAPSGAWLTLHLPPESDVTPPETLTVCRERDCATATLPSVTAEGMSATFQTTRPEVTGTDTVLAGGRVLRIAWMLRSQDVVAADPRNAYEVDVKDATGAVTGMLSGEVTYAHSGGCHGDLWMASLSD